MELLGIPGVVWVQGGAATLLAFTVLAVLVGKLYPVHTVDRIDKAHELRLSQERSRGDEWKAFGEAQGARNELLAEQLAELTEVARTTNALIEGLRRAVESRHVGGQ